MNSPPQCRHVERRSGAYFLPARLSDRFRRLHSGEHVLLRAAWYLVCGIQSLPQIAQGRGPMFRPGTRATPMHSREQNFRLWLIGITGSGLWQTGHISFMVIFYRTCWALARQATLAGHLADVGAFREARSISPIEDRIADFKARIFNGDRHTVIRACATERQQVTTGLQNAQGFGPCFDLVRDSRRIPALSHETQLIGRIGDNRVA